MIDNVNHFLGTVAESELGQAARHSARAIWNAHRAAFETTRAEAGKVITLVIGEGQKLARRVKPASRRPQVDTPQHAPHDAPRRLSHATRLVYDGVSCRTPAA